jgi:guanosine-3',5'-bis(diphosphate) 3'-pyrophosphohydrolase
LTHTLILTAAHFSAQKHSTQRRKDEDASPYINHPISVALTIAQIGGVDDPKILAAALLHDTISNTVVFEWYI